MSGKKYIEEKHNERLYYSSVMRTTCLALVSKSGDIYPWSTNEWSEKYPELASFLNDPESDYGKTEEDYRILLVQFAELFEIEPWLNKYCQSFIRKDQIEYLPAKPFNLKMAGMFSVVLLFGLFFGWLMFG